MASPSGRTRNGKRKLQETPTKIKRRNNPETTPKKQCVLERGDHSPLKESTFNELELTPIVKAKCFYGLIDANKIKSGSNKSIRNNTGLKEKSIVSDITLGNGKRFSPNSRLNKKILDKIRDSPVKQALLQDCTVEQFKRIYKDEIKALVKEIDLEDRPKTRRLSKIVISQIEDDSEEDNDFDETESNIDDDKCFNVQNDGLDTDERNHLASNLNRDEIERQLCDSDDENDISGSFIENNDEPADKNSINLKVSEVKGISQSSSQKRFFKNRKPAENVRKTNITFGKGFNLKFGSQPDKKKKTHNKTKQNKNNKFNSPKPCMNKDQNTEHLASFSFAAGFLSPRLTPENENHADVIVEHTDQVETLSLNRDGMKNYDSSPMIASISSLSKSTYPVDESKSDTALKELSPTSTADSVDLISEADVNATTSQETRLYNGSEDLFSMEDNTSNLSNDAPEGDNNIKEKQRNSNCGSGSSRKLFSIFNKSPQQGNNSPTSRASEASPLHKEVLSPLVSRLPRACKTSLKEDRSQMILDAGQKQFGATQCPMCGMVYCQADPFDEASHDKFHKRLMDVLKFPGWKHENVVQEFPLDMGRVIMVLPEAPKYARRKVDEISKVMGKELGFPDHASSYLHPDHKVFLYVSSDKEIEGCCVAEPIQKGFRVISDDLDTSQSSGQRPWCCTSLPEKACVGISRLWVASSKRRSGVASKLVDCIMNWFEYGCVIPKHMIAFSDPTPDGRRFAQKYMGTPTFLVYKFNDHKKQVD